MCIRDRLSSSSNIRRYGHCVFSQRALLRALCGHCAGTVRALRSASTSKACASTAPRQRNALAEVAPVAPTHLPAQRPLPAVVHARRRRTWLVGSERLSSRSRTAEGPRPTINFRLRVAWTCTCSGHASRGKIKIALRRDKSSFEKLEEPWTCQNGISPPLPPLES